MKHTELGALLPAKLEKFSGVSISPVRLELICSLASVILTFNSSKKIPVQTPKCQQLFYISEFPEHGIDIVFITNACMVQIFLLLPFHLHFLSSRLSCEFENALGYSAEFTSVLSRFLYHHTHVMIFLTIFPEYLKISFRYFRKSIHNMDIACLKISHLLFILYQFHTLTDSVTCCQFITHFHVFKF